MSAIHTRPDRATMVFAMAVLLVCQCVWGGKFTIAVIPDPQNEVDHGKKMLQSQLQWIAQHRTSDAIEFVIGVGDTINGDTPDHHRWKTASKLFSILDRNRVPYALAVGNHDTGAMAGRGSGGPGSRHDRLRHTKQFNQFFPVQRFIAQRGRYEEGKSDNAWYTFQAGGAEWLVLTLELWPRQGALDWAKGVVASHPNHNVIIATHSYLTGKGTILRSKEYGDLSPKAMHNQLVSQYPNILLVLSGHVGTSAQRSDVGAKGNRVYEILQDYQKQKKGGGFLRLLEIDTSAHTISARMFSPYTKETKKDKSAFAFSNVKFIAPAQAEALH